MQRRLFLSAVTLAASALAAAGAAAGVREAFASGLPPVGFPLRPIRLVISFPAGGQTDGLVRVLAANASAILGQPVLVDNQPGAGASLPLKALQAAPADGYTLAQMPLGVYRSSPPEGQTHGAADDEVVPVIHVTGYALGVTLAPDSPLASSSGFADWTRAAMGRLLYGPDSPPLTLELIADRLRQQARQLLTGGAGRPSDVPPRQGHDDAASAQAETPSALQELGLGVIRNEPLGIGAPRGTPAAVVKQLHDAFAQAMAQPNFRQALGRAGAS